MTYLPTYLPMTYLPTNDLPTTAAGDNGLAAEGGEGLHGPAHRHQRRGAPGRWHDSSDARRAAVSDVEGCAVHPDHHLCQGTVQCDDMCFCH